MLNSNAAYEQLAKRADTRQILGQFNMAGFYEPSRVRAVLGFLGNVSNSNQIFANATLYAQFYSLAEQLRALLRIASASKELLEQPKFQALPPGEGILELELIEYADEVGITPS